jgi:hypothetical protein
MSARFDPRRRPGDAVVRVAVSAAVYAVLPFYWLPAVVRGAARALRMRFTRGSRGTRGIARKMVVLVPRWSRRGGSAARRAGGNAVKRTRRAWREVRQEGPRRRQRIVKRGRRFVRRWLAPVARRVNGQHRPDGGSHDAGQ